ncbi:hypothetical protein L1049_020538 [Liquidambar formosana]|uniref:Uncharacterized protein n=1 Tax=Liquidambar formosana TaxID=63359 RepID=A0AAP0SE44_LIQFO
MAHTPDSFRSLREEMRQRYPLSGDGVSSVDWTNRVTETLGVVKRTSVYTCIHEVPNELRKVNKSAYRPRIVSIGPLHEGEHSQMDEHKWRYTLHLLQRRRGQDKIPDICKAIFDLEPQARGSYAKTIKFNAFELAEILLVDGCFIIELFLRFSSMPFYKHNSDLIFRNAWMVPALRHDLQLLENQIPFFVLEQLLEICVPCNLSHGSSLIRSDNIIDLALLFFQLNMNQEVARGIHSKDVMHMLDLLHKYYLPPSPSGAPKDRQVRGFDLPTPYQRAPTRGFYLPTSHSWDPKDKETHGFKKCATKLLEAGIEIKKGTEDHLLDIRFGNGVVMIPPFFIQETTESLLRNFIAYEQCNLGSSHHITSYAILVKSLIHSSLDVELLEKKGIIINELGGVEQVLNLFNNISREVALKDFYFGELCKDVNAHQNSWWHRVRHKAFWRVLWKRQMASLKRNYFPNPWRTISVIAAVLLLFLTGLQTIYTVRTFYNPSKNL